ncbi:MAG: hypothetical protein WEB58_09495 [Planctomycetaceae bacterium]
MIAFIPIFIGAMMLMVPLGCSDPTIPKVNDRALPKANSKLLDPNGNFMLYVSNQSFEINPVDVRVTIDGELVVSDDFRVGTQHTFVPFTLSLSEERHQVHIWSEKGDAELSKEFELKDHDVGVITFWYYPKSHYTPTPPKFDFHTQKGPFAIH